MRSQSAYGEEEYGNVSARSRHSDFRSALIAERFEKARSKADVSVHESPRGNTPAFQGLTSPLRLDPDYHQEVDQNIINNSDQGVLGFAKKPSFENAFFIYPEDERKLADLLYVHASVNLLNSFITEICSKDFGSSKERVKKILNVLEEMIMYLEPEKDDLIGEDDNFLDAPYSMEANDKINGRLQKVKEK
jgi:hypothetical protein